MNVFGLASYNAHSDKWELTKPLAFIQNGYEGDYVSDLALDKFITGCGFVFRGIIAFYCVKWSINIGRSLIQRIRE